MTENDIKIEYDGEYPGLCTGNLTVTINGKEWKFPEYSLRSGGRVWIDEDYEEHVEEWEWDIVKWPEGFPKEYKVDVLEKVNEEIPHGCCGGCL